MAKFSFPMFVIVILLSTHNTNSQDYFPPAAGDSEGWATINHTDAGADPDLLKKAMQLAGEKNSKGVVVLRRGKILKERYWDGWSKDSVRALNSATKSLVSTMVGKAIDDEHLEGPDQSCSDFIARWQIFPQYQQIKIKHLLSMTSGLKLNRGIFTLGFLVKDEHLFASQLPIAYPAGEHWDYHNSAYKLLFPILEASTGSSLGEYFQENLFGPLGMAHARWKMRHNNPEHYSLIEMSTRDAARFGLMVLRDGRWHQQQIVSADWINHSTRPFDDQLNPSYGHLWWLNGGSHFFYPLNNKQQPGPIFEGCPDDAFAALGKDDQKIYIVPSLELVVVRLGDKADGVASTPALSEFDSKFLGLICQSFAAQE